MTPAERAAFDAIVREFDLPFSLPEAQQIAQRVGIGASVTKRSMQIWAHDGLLEHVGNDGPRKLWWWVDEQVA